MEFSKANYFEIDYPPIIEIKKETYHKLGFSDFENTCLGLDITDSEELENIITKILHKKTYKKVIILSEGLSWYLSQSAIQKLTEKFLDKFSQNNFIWITADCPTLNKNQAEYRNTIANSAKIAKEKTFPNYENFNNFFARLNLKNERYKLLDIISIDDLSTARLFDVDKRIIKNKLDTYTDCAVLRLATTPI